MSITVLNTDAGLDGTTLLNSESAQNVTGLKTFNRTSAVPFACASTSIAVPYLRNSYTISDTSTGSQNDWVPGSGLTYDDTTIYWSGASDISLTGMAGGVAGQRVTLWNASTGVMSLAHQSSSSVSTNRFFNHVSSAATRLATYGKATYVHTGSYWALEAHEQGSFITSTFSAGDFTGNNSMTWTVAAGDRNIMRYKLSGNTLFVQFQLATTTVGGTPSTALQIAVAQFGGYQPSVANFSPLSYVNDNGTLVEAYATVNATHMQIIRTSGANWTAATDATYVYGNPWFEVA